MSLTEGREGRPVHFPQDPKQFVFDQEVSRIFPDMAGRSIPLFYETHRLHAHMCARWMSQDEVDIIDVGASRGAFLSEMDKLYNLRSGNLRVSATDLSVAMVEFLQQDFPSINAYVSDLTTDAFLGSCRKYDIINCTYVLQFVKPEMQVTVLRKLATMLKPGGVLFLGQKVDSRGPCGRLLHEQYIRFRLENGYSQDEIDAKTAALQNSMWPMTEENISYYLNKYGVHVQPTTRWTVFSNFMCTRGL